MSNPSNGKQAVLVREMELEDLPWAFALGEREFTAERLPNLYRTWDEYELLNLFASDRETCLVAESEEDGRPLGFVLGSLLEKRRGAWNYGWLLWLAVEPEARRLGVATRLTHKLTELFLKQGARMMLVDTDARNLPAIRFLQRQGFGNPREHLYLTRNLTQTEAYKRLRRREADPERVRGEQGIPGVPGGEHG